MQLFPLPCLALAALAACACAQEAQIEQARQFAGREPAVESRFAAGTPAFTSGDPAAGIDDSFGLQQFLKRQPKLQMFRAFAEVSAFATNNVALARRDEIADSFLVAAFGLECRRPIAKGVQWEATLRAGGFRYNEVRALDFDSLDAGTGITWHAEKVWDVDFFLRYNFNDLVSRETEETFFKNHTITLGVQKAVAFSRAHYAFAGMSAQAGFADPREARCSSATTRS